MPNLLATSGDAGLAMGGNYNFGDASLFIPEVTTVPAAESNLVGSMYHVKTSGVLAIQSGVVGGDYAIFSLDSLGFDFAVGSGQSPLEVASASGLLAWYDATESTIGLVGPSGVTSWGDFSANGNNLDANDGPPDYGDDGGVSGMLLNGTSDMFISSTTGPGSGIAGTDKPFTVIAAFRQTDVTNIGGIFSFAHSAVNVINIFGLVRDAGSWQLFKRDSASAQVGITIGQSDSTIPQVASWTHTGTECSIFASGTAQTAAASGMDVGLVNGLDLNSFGGLDRFGFGKSTHFKGWLYSIAVWDRELSSEERVDIEANFAERYGVTMGTYSENQ